MDAPRRRRLKRPLDSLVIHFDYDAFYASVIERETPSLRTRPLAVQQKQIVVTCNYEARRRGLYKLQLIKEAKQICPDLVVVLGEDLTRFRNASKELYAFLRTFSWNSRCERLGFDEVWMDVTDLVDYNRTLLNPNDLTNSFFCLSKKDPSVGFPFDASNIAGETYPGHADCPPDVLSDPPYLRLLLGSHLAQYIRKKLELEKSHTCTVGISTNKLLSKLVGNVHKPDNQTTLLPPYTFEDEQDNVAPFIDNHEVGKIPGIGSKLAQKIRAHVLQRPAGFDTGLVYGGTNECVLVGDVRKYPGMGPEVLEQILGGPGTPHGIGARTWGLLNGCDDTQVGQARDVPTQISLEDSYIRLDTMDEVRRELFVLARSLLNRMHVDLMEDEEDFQLSADAETNALMSSDSPPKRWIAFPRTLRLTTRPRPPQNPDGSRNRSFARISRSGPMPNFVFGLRDSIDVIAQRLVAESLVPLFRKLHPEKSGWNLSLMNVAATNMVDAASEKGGVGRDISKMFKRQDNILKDFDMEEPENPLSLEAQGGSVEVEAAGKVSSETSGSAIQGSRGGSEDVPTPSQEARSVGKDLWGSDNEDVVDGDLHRCECGAVMPFFAVGAHARWHAQS